jgi:hypothetical protein
VTTQNSVGEPFRYARRVGKVLTTLGLLFLTIDGVGKVVMVPEVVQTTATLGFAADLVRPLGLVLLACVALTAVPRSAALGTVLCTGFLGGAVATHVRAGSPLLSHTLFPVYVGIFLWVGLWLRDETVRRLLPITR